MIEGGRRGAALVAFAVLAGCTQTNEVDRPATTVTAPAEITDPGPSEPPPAAAASSSSSSSSAPSPGVTVRAAVQPPPPPPPQPARPNLPRDLGVLRGMAPLQVRQALGEPNVLRRDSGVEVWQYYGADCVLDLFLYREAQGWRVLHHHLRSTLSDASARRECLQTSPEGPVSG